MVCILLAIKRKTENEMQIETANAIRWVIKMLANFYRDREDYREKETEKYV